MITLTTEQAQQIEWALNGISNHPQLGAVINTGPCKEALATIRAARAQEQAEPKCNPHPDAPHGFDRNASHSANRYVCECEGWEPEQAKQEPVAAYKDAPRVIYLQTGCEDPEFCECSFNEWGDTTWCADKIHDTDIPYIREDYAAHVRTKDLTDDEAEFAFERGGNELCLKLRAVIAADRSKNGIV